MYSEDGAIHEHHVMKEYKGFTPGGTNSALVGKESLKFITNLSVRMMSAEASEWVI
jgi:hypothetical protein